jgi:hypothetical protein
MQMNYLLLGADGAGVDSVNCNARKKNITITPRNSLIIIIRDRYRQNDVDSGTIDTGQHQFIVIAVITRHRRPDLGRHVTDVEDN